MVAMLRTPLTTLAFGLTLAAAAVPSAYARDTVTITIPLRSRLSPVQRLNREGVAAIKHDQYDKAESMFLKAYLYDPGDPFTLNNLGYISELQGQLGRAEHFYQLAEKQGSNASIDMSNKKDLKGKPMLAAVEGLQDIPMRVDRMNVDSVQLLADNRGFEAVSLLHQALRLDPKNPFTLNNLGVADESIGDFRDALQFYNAAAESHSTEPVVVSLDRSWRGRPVSEMAAASAKRLEKKIREAGSTQTESAMLNVRGVYEANEDDWPAARADFLRAYSLDPTSAFSLNNRGYVAERDGDLESAQFFYMKARQADGANARVGLATQQSARGQSLLQVSSNSTFKVDGALEQYSRQQRRQTGPIELIPRGGSPPGSSSTPHDGHSSSNEPESAPTPTPTPQQHTP